MHEEGKDGRAGGLGAWLDDETLTAGQRKRLTIFQSVEALACARIEELCGHGGVEVSDAAVLVIAPEAQGIFFEETYPPGVSVVIGHRSRIPRLPRRHAPTGQGGALRPLRRPPRAGPPALRPGAGD